MTAFRLFLIVALATVLIYTVMTLTHFGSDLITPAIAELTSFSWPGQFALDFVCYLLLSALWIAWRHNFSPAGFGLAAIASIGGLLFFAPYLLFASFRANGNVQTLLLGETRHSS